MENIFYYNNLVYLNIFDFDLSNIPNQDISLKNYNEIGK